MFKRRYALNHRKMPHIPSLYGGRYGALWPPPHMFPYLHPALPTYHLPKENGTKLEKHEDLCDSINFKVPCGKHENYPPKPR